MFFGFGGLVFFCFSCKKEEQKNFNASNIEEETTTELDVIEDPNLWSLGGVEACTNPRPDVSYQDVSQDFGFEGQNFMGAAVEGGMALQNYQNEWWLWQVHPQSAVEGHSENGQMRRFETDMPFSRLYVLDLDQNGKEELLILGEFLDVVWNLQYEDEYREQLLPLELLHGVRDIGLFDIEGDGDLDLWVFQDHPELAIRGFVLKQEAPGVFSAPEIFASADQLGVVFETAVFDWDNDGDPDIYLCNDFGSEFGGNSLLVNDGGLFTEGDAQGADIVVDCMGVSVADMDRDGQLDMYITEGVGHSLLKGSSSGFIDMTLAAGLSPVAERQMLWGSQIIDYNNDGWFDIIAGTSDLSGMDPNFASLEFPIWLFAQTQRDQYQEVGESLGFPQETLSRITLARDINHDGIQDIFVSSAQRLAYVFLSEGCTENNWIEISTSVDAMVSVFSNGESWTIQSTQTPGMAASMPALAHIGLGSVEQIDRIEVQIPWKGVYALEGPIEARQRIQLSLD